MDKPVLLPDPRAEFRKADADRLREIADAVERGDIIDFVFVANHTKDREFMSVGSFEDRWRILGALEYAKYHVHTS